MFKRIFIGIFTFLLKNAWNEIRSCIKSYLLITRKPLDSIENLNIGMVSVEGVIMPGHELTTLVSEQSASWYENQILEGDNLLLLYREDNFFFIDDGLKKCLISTFGADITCGDSKKWGFSILPSNLKQLKEKQNQINFKELTKFSEVKSDAFASKIKESIASKQLRRLQSDLDSESEQLLPGKQGAFSCKEDLLTAGEKIKVIGYYRSISLDTVNQLIENENYKEKRLIENRKSVEMVALDTSVAKNMLLALKDYLMKSEKESIELITMSLKNDPYIISPLSTQALKSHYIKKASMYSLLYIGIIYTIYFIFTVSLK